MTTAGGGPAARVSDPAFFRHVLGQLPTGVTLITGLDPAGRPVGMAVGSFTSLSLDPALVTFMPARTSTTWPVIRASGSFCVNVLAADQEQDCRRFAAPGERFASLDWHPGATGSPILDGAVAYIDCTLEAEHPGGDHDIVVGRVLDLDEQRSTLPLLFHRGGYGGFTPLSSTTRDPGYGPTLALLDQVRPLMVQAAEQAGAQVLAATCDGLTMMILASAGAPQDPGTPAAAVGMTLPVAAPVGIWWAACTTPAQRARWLSGIDDATLRDRYAEALDAVRATGYCLGLPGVYAGVARQLGLGGGNPGPGGAPRPGEVDPFAYVPRDTEDRHDDLVSLWAPSFGSDGDVQLEFALHGYRRAQAPLEYYANVLTALTDKVSRLTGAG